MVHCIGSYDPSSYLAIPLGEGQRSLLPCYDQIMVRFPPHALATALVKTSSRASSIATRSAWPVQCTRAVMEDTQ
jgi:hypothetical protein